MLIVSIVLSILQVSQRSPLLAQLPCYLPIFTSSSSRDEHPEVYNGRNPLRTEPALVFCQQPLCIYMINLRKTSNLGTNQNKKHIVKA